MSKKNRGKKGKTRTPRQAKTRIEKMFEQMDAFRLTQKKPQRRKK